MVKVRDDYPLTEDGAVDLVRWVDQMCAFDCRFDEQHLLSACEMTQAADLDHPGGEHAWAAMSSLVAGLEIARILVELKLDETAIVAGILYRTVREEKLELEQVENTFGHEVANLIEGVMRMAAISNLQKADERIALGSSAEHKQNLRKMLVAMVDDVRVALIKLAERTCALRAVKREDAQRQVWVAREIFDIYAPLAHRLGIGQLKWELEDLSFRYLEPQAYKHIAGLLYEKRVERDSYIESVRHSLEDLLTSKGIEADVTGRSKHIYSIWRKMQRKRIDFFQVYDVRAVRVLVPTIADCYATLGLVHGLWQHIPKEFDDYIATPKENGYRSLHTAVLGPESKILEVQIRTFDMHDEAELGVCAHWMYKEGAKNQGVSAYDHKIAWLRQVLEWQDELGDTSVGDLVSQIREEIVDERVYVFTPEGDVVDLQNGATPIDFAYQVHTEVGERCRGAKVNGRIVPLNYKLNTGERVEILATKNGGPSRDWLNPNLKYVKTSRAKTKIQHWFKQQDREQNITYGRQMLDRELYRLRITAVDWPEVAVALNVTSLEDIQAGLGAGDLRLGQVLNTVQNLRDAKDGGADATSTDDEKLSLHRKTITRRRPVAKDADIEVQGVGNLLTHLAGCCKPVPGDEVVGYVSVGKGISVHREDCKDLAGLSAQYPDRVIEVNWREEVEQFYPVIVSISAYDRQGLLRDVSVIFANARVNVMQVQTKTDEHDQMARMYLHLEVKSLAQLRNVMDKVAQLPSVIEVRRAD
jgi:GTP pyrophosphokinase